MFQGQICRIETREHQTSERVSGWFQKLKDDASSGAAYFQVDGNQSMKIELGKVDDSMLNKHPDRPFMIALIVPTEVQVKHTSIDDSIAIEASIASIREKIKSCEAERSFQKSKYDSLRQGLAEAAHQYLQCNREIAAFEAIVNEAVATKRIPLFMYAYGKHTEDGVEYCWRVPVDLQERIKPGVTVLCATRCGAVPAVVTRVERLPQYLEHKMVLGVAV